MKLRMILTALISTALFSGCSHNLPQVEAGSLLLDTQAQLLCLDNAANCRSLSLIGANAQRDRVLQHWPGDRWDWSRLDSPTKLANLLLAPPEQTYQVTSLSESRYRLSTHAATLDAWHALNNEQRLRFLEER